MTISWREWSDEVFAVAREERRPVLLSIVAAWCRFCREMDATTFADERVQAAVADYVIPVRVDKDLRPDLDARYGQGGWPSTVLIEPGTREALAGTTYCDARSLVVLMAEAARRVRTVGPARAAPAAAEDVADPDALDASILPSVERALLSAFDERHGGFGSGQKFPHPEAIDFALVRYADAPRAELLPVIEKTLTHLAAGRLYDAVDGGFFRFCARRDWTQPHTEKRLDVNAGLLRNFLEAGQLLERADFLDVGGRTVDFVLEHLHDEETGLFHASLPPADEYYRLDAAGRRTRGAPRPDGRFLADVNARMISALFKAGAVLAREDVTHAAREALTALVGRLWHPERGMYHHSEEGRRRLPGLLRDQAETARTILHALQFADDRVHLDVLTDLLTRIANDHRRADGELGDRVDVLAGVPRRLDQAIVENAIAAEALIRGALVTASPALAAVAREALAVHAADFRRYGYAMASYGRAVELVLHPPLHILVVGPRGDERTRALLRAASAAFLPSRVVQLLDPVEDAVLIEVLELPERRAPVCFVHLEHDCAAEHDDPATLVVALRDANRRRAITRPS